jgi:Cysteine-rich secretory protein family
MKKRSRCRVGPVNRNDTLCDNSISNRGGFKCVLVHQNGIRGLLGKEDSQNCSISESELTDFSNSEISSSTENSLYVERVSVDRSWVSAGVKNFHNHTPLFVKPSVHLGRNESDGISCRLHRSDEQEEFTQIMAKSRRLPGTWYYSSGHVLVNKERVKRNIPALTRQIELDSLARDCAKAMASEGRVRHSHADEIQCKIQPCRRFGENVARGKSVRGIHLQMLNDDADRNNIIDRRYAFMGMGTARGDDGLVYLCQIFKG